MRTPRTLSSHGLGIFYLIHCVTFPLIAQNPISPVGNDGLGFDVGGKMFFDARTTGFSADGRSQIFRGEVVAIGTGVLITADQIVFDQNTKIMEATGHVVVITERQIFTGDRIVYRVNNGDFRIDSALMISNDQQQSERISRRVLGFTPKEVEFESQRKERLDELNRRKDSLRKEFRSSVGTSDEANNDLIDRYALILEQEEIAQKSENPALAKLSPDRRKVFESRRAYWEAGRKSVSIQSVPSYFRIQGKVLERTDDNNYSAKEAVWSPCKCEADESPAWGFRANTVEAQVGGYVDLYHPVLEIRGVPLLYLPYLKLPVKSQRQTGFLMPVFSLSKQSGNTYSQPLFLALAENQDATITTDLIEKRGTKLGLEWRWKTSRLTGWTLNLEGIRDRSWLGERETRIDIVEAKNDAGIAVGDDFQVPPNTWRSAKRWNGLTILSPRAHLVSSGQIYSDHRYVDDLSIPNSVQNALDGGHRSTYLVPSRAQYNYAGRDLFASMGSGVADNMSSIKPYSGFQEPLRLNLHSRLIRMTPRTWSRFPVYASLSGQSIRLNELHPKTSIVDTNSPDIPDELGNGNWTRSKLDVVSPLLPDAIVGVEAFADAEVRQIHTNTDRWSSSQIRSWRAGLTFRLPMEGESETPGWLFKDKVSGDDQAVNGILHRMDWSMTLSARPSVIRSSDYANVTNPAGQLQTYFVSDTEKLLGTPGFTEVVSPSDGMSQHRRVEFATSQRWIYFTREWRLKSADRSAPTAERAQARTYLERARQELLFSLDKNVRGVNELFQTENGKTDWFINRYNYQTTGESEFFTLGGNIGYDFLKAETRERLREQDDPDASNPRFRPWDVAQFESGLTLFGGSFNSKANYNIYDRLMENSEFYLSPPGFWSTQTKFSLQIVKNDASSRKTIRGFDISTTAIPNVTASLGLARQIFQNADSENLEQYRAIYSLAYRSPSDCWQLTFVRNKAFEDSEREAHYVFAIDVLFLGQTRPVVDLGKSDNTLRTLNIREF